MNRQRITVPEAAQQSGVLVSYLYALLASGRLKGEKVDGKWQIERADFDAWRRQHRFYTKRRSTGTRSIERSAQEAFA